MSTATFTRSQTFTRSDAAYVASKMEADLYRMKRLYGAPSDYQRKCTIAEVIELLSRGYLRDVHIGFKRNGKWVVAVRYEAHNGGLIGDDSAGGVPAGVNIAGAAHYNYLRYNSAFFALSQLARDRVEASLPWSRNGGELPSEGEGAWTSDRTYSRNGGGTTRSSFGPR